MTDSKVQLNKNKVNNRTKGHTKEDTAVTERLWQIGFYKQVSFELLPEEGSRCCTAYIIRKIIPNLRSIKTKTMAIVLD